MQNGDIDNSMSSRMLVHVAELFKREPKMEKVFGVIPVVSSDFLVDMRSVASYARMRDTTGVVMHLFHYSNDGYPAQQMFEYLDENGIYHPFTNLMEFADYADLAGFYAYSADIIRIIDPLHPLGFGSGRKKN